MLTHIDFGFHKITNCQNDYKQQCIVTMVYNRAAFELLTHTLCRNTAYPLFLEAYSILLHTSKLFVSFLLSGCPSPLHHLANPPNIHVKCQLRYEPFPSLTLASHSKKSAAPCSAPLTPCIDLIIMLHGRGHLRC